MEDGDRMGGWMEGGGLLDGWMDGWIDGWMIGRGWKLDGWIDDG